MISILYVTFIWGNDLNQQKTFGFGIGFLSSLKTEFQEAIVKTETNKEDLSKVTIQIKDPNTNQSSKDLLIMAGSIGIEIPTQTQPIKDHHDIFTIHFPKK